MRAAAYARPPDARSGIGQQTETLVIYAGEPDEVISMDIIDATAAAT